MLKYKYYLICFINPISRRTKETEIMFSNKNDAELFVYIQSKLNPKYNFFYKEVIKSIYTSLDEYKNGSNLEKN